jgi:RsiW-degrading membrane proteinase PrsW (M82 family)
VILALLVGLAVLPALALVVYFYLRDRYEPEPRRYVVAAFLYGPLVLVPALWLGARLRAAVGPEWLALSGLGGRLYEDLVVAAAVEEGLKWLLFVATILRWREFDEPMDGVVYGATMALGLAAVENLYYVLECHGQPGCGVWQRALLRGVFSVPAHALFGASMGYFLGRAKFVAHRARLGYLLPASLVVPWAFHGLYDHLCSYVGQPAGWIVLGAVSLGMWIFVLLAVSRALGRSPFKADRSAIREQNPAGGNGGKQVPTEK